MQKRFMTFSFVKTNSQHSSRRVYKSDIKYVWKTKSQNFLHEINAKQTNLSLIIPSIHGLTRPGIFQKLKYNFAKIIVC